MDLNGVLLVDPGPSVDLSNTQMMPGPAQTVVVTSTQPPPQHYTHPTITTLAPLGKTDFSFLRIIIELSFLNVILNVT